MAEMKLYPLEEVLDEHFGKIGTPERDTFEKRSQMRSMPSDLEKSSGSVVWIRI